MKINLQTISESVKVISANWPTIFGIIVITLFINSCKPEEDPAPVQLVITTISPQRGFAGTTLSISGKGFATEAAKNVVKINSMKATVQEVQGDTLITVLVPENASTGAVQVLVNDQLANGPLFTVPRNANPPVITSVTPASVEVGDLITITGSNFKTGTELDQNTVRISGLKVKIASGTATELKVRVPGVPKQPSVSVTVAVQGTASNALPLQVNGFEGKLVWVSSTKYNPTITYKVVANADGSSVVRDERVIANKGPFSERYWKFAYNPRSRTTYFYLVRTGSRVMPNGFLTIYLPEFWQADEELSDIRMIYNLDFSYDYPGVGFLISSIDGDGFYFSTGGGQISEGFKDAGSDLTLRRKMGPSDMGQGHIRVIGDNSTSASLAAAGSNSIWVNGYLVSPTITKPSLKLDARDPYSVCYDPIGRNFYYSGYDVHGTVSIYQVAEDGGPSKLVTEISKRTAQSYLLAPRYLQVLNTPTGIKLFWISDSFGFPGESVWFLNLKGEPPYSPVLLYDTPEQISFDPRTYPVPNGSTDFRISNVVSLFYVVPN